MMRLLLVITSVLAAVQGTATSSVAAIKVTIDNVDYSCKSYQGDTSWPSKNAWGVLNATVEGNLLAVTPIGSVCYRSFHGKPTYNADQCTQSTANNLNASWVVKDPAQVMWTFYTNNTCDPGTGQQDTECTTGYYPDFVITAKSAAHVAAGVNFARENNIRLVIRNTGHDFMGRSTGRGSLAINTQHFQQMDFVDQYNGPGQWKGGAVTLGAGVVFRDLYPAAFKKKVVVVGGECPTVGIAGGYVQGGGHGPLSGYHGLAVDNVLGFDVVTASGEAVKANAEVNSDLFWALKGGGPSTFGVVVSMTVKTHPEVPTIAMLLNITGPAETFWRGVTHFRAHANVFANAGMYVWFAMSGNSLRLQPVVAPNSTRADFDKVAVPLLDKLTADNVTFQVQTREFRTFYEMYDYSFGKTNDAGGQQSLMGGRLIVRDDITTHTHELVDVMRKVLEAGYIYGGHVVNPGVAIAVPETSVHPSWYNSASQDLYITPVKALMTTAERRKVEDVVTWELGQPLRNASPKSASYVNEGDVNEPNWQETYWGANYPRLIEIKKKWDPQGVFYAKATPGTEEWAEILDGKLCKKA